MTKYQKIAWRLSIAYNILLVLLLFTGYINKGIGITQLFCAPVILLLTYLGFKKKKRILALLNMGILGGCLQFSISPLIRFATQMELGTMIVVLAIFIFNSIWFLLATAGYLELKKT